MRILILVIAIAAAAVAAPTALLATPPAHPAWAPEGNPVVTAAGDQYGIVAAPFGSGGVLVVWEDDRAGDSNQTDLYALALEANGLRAPGWPADGVAVSTVSGAQRYVSVITDPGGVYVTWFDWRETVAAAYLLRLSNDGSVAAGWPTGGLRLGEDAWYTSRAMAPDGNGGVYTVRADPSVVPNVTRIHRIGADAAPAPGWPPDGISLGEWRDPEPALLADGAGGVYVVSVRSVDEHYRAQGVVRRLGPDGAPHLAWPAEGVLIGSPAYAHWGLQAFPGGSGGLFVTWSDAIGICAIPADPVGFGPCSNQQLARLDASGAVTPGWEPEGLTLGPGGTVAPDGFGGVLYAWSHGYFFTRPAIAWGQPATKLTRYDGTGERVPGWPAQGNSICSEEGFQSSVRIVSDDSGGALLSWVDWRTQELEPYVSRLNAAGHVAEGWPRSGSKAAPTDRGVWETAMVDAGDERAIFVWVSARNGTRDIYADVVVPGPPGPPAPLAGVFDGSAQFGIMEMRPNPTRGTFWAIIGLPEPGRATLELFDLAGRVVEETSVEPGFPARGAVRLNVSRTMAPGVYWLRLRQGGRLATTRIVVAD